MSGNHNREMVRTYTQNRPDYRAALPILGPPATGPLQRCALHMQRYAFGSHV